MTVDKSIRPSVVPQFPGVSPGTSRCSLRRGGGSPLRSPGEPRAGRLTLAIGGLRLASVRGGAEPRVRLQGAGTRAGGPGEVIEGRALLPPGRPGAGPAASRRGIGGGRARRVRGRGAGLQGNPTLSGPQRGAQWRLASPAALLRPSPRADPVRWERALQASVRPRGRGVVGIPTGTPRVAVSRVGGSPSPAEAAGVAGAWVPRPLGWARCPPGEAQSGAGTRRA